MNAQAILDRIQEDAKAAASTILQEASQRADALKQGSEQRMAAKRAETLAQAKQDAKEAAGRMERMAELDQRKLMLADKRKLMDQAFRLALTKLHQLPADQARALFLQTLLQAAEGGEQLMVGAIHPEWFDEDFLNKANQQLHSAGKTPLTAAADTGSRPYYGFTLLRGDMETDCSMEAMLEEKRLSLESHVAQILFPA